MKIKSGFVKRSVGGNMVVVPVGGAALDLSGMITLNEVGSFLWDQLLQDTAEADLLQAVLEEYEVEAEVASEDIRAFLGKLREANLLE